MRGLTYRYSGREQQATLELERAENELRTQLKTTPEFEPALGALCLCLAALGKRTETEKMCAALLEKPIHDAMQIDETRYLVAMSLAMVKMRTNEPSKYLRACYRTRITTALPIWNWTRHLSACEPNRDSLP